MYNINNHFFDKLFTNVYHYKYYRNLIIAQSASFVEQFIPGEEILGKEISRFEHFCGG